MFRRAASLSVLLGLLVQGPVQAADMKVEIAAVSESDLALLARWDMSVEDRRDDTVVVRIRSSQLRLLEQAGFAVRVIVPDIATERTEPPPIADADQYHSYEDLKAELAQLEYNHFTIVRLHVLGTSIQARDIMAVEISDNAGRDENEPQILFDAATHGNEWSTMETALCLVRNLAEGYGTDARVTRLVNERRIWVIPMVNPDGVTANSRQNANGVDCNRDFGYMWDAWGGSTAPFSQPETRALWRLALAQSFVFAVSLHSGNEILVYPWSYKPTPTADSATYEALGARYSALTGFPSGQSAHEGYRVVGTSKDLYYGSFGALSASIELSAQKTPLFSEIAAVCARQMPAALDLIEKSGQGIAGVFLDAATSKPVPAMIRIGEPAWVAYAAPASGSMHRFLLPGKYDLKIAANGYAPVWIRDVEVVSQAATDVSAALMPEPQPQNYGYRVLYNAMPDIKESGDRSVECLGPPDGIAFAIGKNGYAVIDMGPGFHPIDQPGPEVFVHQASSTPEGFSLYAAEQPLGPWKSMGQGAGTKGFDLAAAGSENVRYFKIVDDNVAAPLDDIDDGYDLDAIQVIGVEDFDTDTETGADTDTDADSDTDADAANDLDPIAGGCDCRFTGVAASPQRAPVGLLRCFSLLP